MKHKSYAERKKLSDAHVGGRTSPADDRFMGKPQSAKTGLHRSLQEGRPNESVFASSRVPTGNKVGMPKLNLPPIRED